MQRRSARVLVALALAIVAAGAIVSATAGAAGAGWWTPPQRLTWFWQLQGKVSNAHAVAAYDIDEAGLVRVHSINVRGLAVLPTTVTLR